MAAFSTSISVSLNAFKTLYLSILLSFFKKLIAF